MSTAATVPSPTPRASPGLDFPEDGRAFAVGRSRPGRRPGSHSEESKFAAAQAVAESGREWLQRGQFRPQGHAQQPGCGGSENHHRDRCGFQVEIRQDRIGFPVTELPPGLVRPREPTGDPPGQDRMAQRGSPDLSGSSGKPPDCDRRRAWTGSETIPFRSPQPDATTGRTTRREAPVGDPPPYSGTWLLEKLAAPKFRLPSVNGRHHDLAMYKGRRVVVELLGDLVPAVPGRAARPAIPSGGSGRPRRHDSGDLRR